MEGGNRRRAKGRPRKLHQNQLLNDQGTSSGTKLQPSTQGGSMLASPTCNVKMEISKTKKHIQEYEDMVGRYVFKSFCGERLLGLVTDFDNKKVLFKIVYQDGNNEVMDKATLVQTLAPRDVIDRLSSSHRMPRLLWILHEKILQNEEEVGKIRFVCIRNDGVDQHMIWLIQLKDIISRQLPDVPRVDIVRLVMDINHKSMLVIRRNQLVGGMTYRPFASKKLGEIAFCAFMADEQAKGYGTRLMNHLKQHARDSDGLTHFLTYAKDNTVDYFTRQGFVKEITLEEEQWKGYIKEYEEGTLMEYKINPQLPYTDLSSLIRYQKEAINKKINEVSNSDIVYPGIEFEKDEEGVPKRPIKLEDIPGLREVGWTPDQYGHSQFTMMNAASSAETASSQNSLEAFIRSLLKSMNEHPDAWPFKEPVDPGRAPNYYEIIKDPMDLKTIAKRVESEKYYITLEMFLADVRRIFTNARTYNLPDTVYYQCANRLESYFSIKVQLGLQSKSKTQP